MRSTYSFGLPLVILLTTACVGGASPAMVLVEGGEFLMGEPGGKDNPAHTVVVDSFYIGRYEVTAAEWRQFSEAEDLHFQWHGIEFTELVGQEPSLTVPGNWAIYYVTWYEAVWYCNWLSEREGLVPAYTLDSKAMWNYLYAGIGPRPVVEWDPAANGYRLPTEAEWEYAATGGRQREKEASSADSLEEFAWCRDNSERTVHPVGSKRPNVMGLYDLLGNVGEWCWDYFDPSYYLSGPRKNPRGPNRGYDPVYFEPNVTEIRSNRGGCWKNSNQYCRATYRFRSWARLQGPVGLRLVRNAGIQPERAVDQK